MDTSATKDTSGDSTTTTAEERALATEDLEEHQDGRFSFAIIYTSKIEDIQTISLSPTSTLSERERIFLSLRIHS